MNKEREVIAEFTDEDQNFLRAVDVQCRAELIKLHQDWHKQKLEHPNKPVTVDDDDQGLLALLTAFGMLYNRAVLVGWIKDAYTEKGLG